jgi:RimJ/RimL family protein N-acetyltransferase
MSDRTEETGKFSLRPVRGTDALFPMIHGFQMPETQKIEPGIFVGNTASRRVFEKNGFKLEGTLEKRGKWLDEWLLGLVRSDYEG